MDRGSSRPGARALPKSESISRDTKCAQERHTNVNFIKERGDKRKLVQKQHLKKWEQADCSILDKSLWLFPQLQEGAECIKTGAEQLTECTEERGKWD